MVIVKVIGVGLGVGITVGVLTYVGLCKLGTCVARALDPNFATARTHISDILSDVCLDVVMQKDARKRGVQMGVIAGVVAAGAVVACKGRK